MADKMVASFRTQYHPHDRVFISAGDRIVPVYEGRLDERGEVEVVEVGKKDLYAEIQSHRDSVDIHVLLQRYQDGDVDVLSRVQGIYGDFTEMPKSYAELLDSVIRGEQMFDNLPSEIRQRFDNSFTQFMASMDRPEEFFDKLKIETPVPDEKKEVSENDA